MFSTGLAFQIPIVQVLLGVLGIVSSNQMLSGWRYVVLGAAVLGAVLTPSTDPLTQSLLGGAVLGLYFGGVGLVKLLGRWELRIADNAKVTEHLNFKIVCYF